MKVINLVEPSQAHKALAKLWNEIKFEIQSGNKFTLIAQTFEEAKTAQQRKYYHGYILLNISEQVKVEGKKYPIAVWKEHYRQKFLGDTVVEVTDIKTGATKKEIRRVSSEGLSVKGYNRLIEQVTADAVTEFNVVFDASFDEWINEQI